MFHLPKKLLALVAPLAIVIGLVAGPAMASAATVTFHKGTKTGTELAKGAEIKGVDSTMEFETAAGSIKCVDNTILGEVTANHAAPATIKINSATFKASGGGAACVTTIGGGLVTAKVTAENLPWATAFNSNGTTTITGTPTVRFKAELSSGSICVFEETSVADTFNFSTSLFDKINGQPLALNVAASTVTCPSSGTLKNGSFALTSGGTAVVATTP